MNSPFAKVQPQGNSSLWDRLSVRRASLVFGVCLLVGLGLVWWRAQQRVNTAYASARTEARACAAALELQLSQPGAAAEVLGIMARHSRLGVTNAFQSTAKEVFATHPGLASVELQPGGVVSEIFPRAGNERALGFNVLKDPGQHAGATEAVARRGLTVVATVTLYHGEPGIVARVPIFQRGPDGREIFWGFVAASMRWQDALARALVQQLPRQGYDFALSVAASPKPRVIAAQGLSSAQDGVQLHAQNLEFRLALKPQGGWISKGKLALDLAALALFSVMASLLVKLLESRQAVDGVLSDAAQQLAREQAERKQAQADGSGMKQKLSALHAELKQLELRRQHEQSRADQIQVQLDGTVREREGAVQAQQAEQQRLAAELEGAQKTIAQLQGRLDAALQAEQQTAAAGAKQLEQNQAAMLELRKQLESATRSARKAAETGAASVAELEQSNRELKARVQALESMEARVPELEELLRKAQEQLASPAAASAEIVRAAPAATPEAPPAAQIEPPKKARRARVAESSEPAQPITVVAETKAPEGSVPASTPLPKADTSVAGVPPASDLPAAGPGPKRRERKPKRPDNQMDLFGKEEPKAQPAIKPAAKEEAKASASPAKGEEPVPARRLPAAPPVDPALLRTATNQIVPLLTDADPGAKDCLRDNRTAFRSAFTPEGYVEFEQLVKGGEFAAALEQLKKAVRKHGL